MRRQYPKRGVYPVTAYGFCNCLGASTSEGIDALAAGRSGLTAPPLALPFDTACGVLPELPPLPPAYASFDTRVTRLAALALADVRDAVSRALRTWGSARVGAIVGTTPGGLAQTEDAFAERAASGLLPSRYDFALQHPFHLVAELACALTGIEGPRYVVSTACSSSAKAFGAARRLLLAGVCDAVLVGGVDTLCETTLRGFHALGILAPEPCRPFGRDRRGVSIGEGGAFLLLERDGAGAAYLLGVGESADAHHMSAPDPSGAGARAAMEQALAQAALSPGEVDYVNAHGTGTRQNDDAEAQAIEAALGVDVPVSSTKGYTGHLLGAAGATEAAFAVVAIERGFVPGTLGCEPLDPGVRIRVRPARTERQVRVALSNSFAFGGSNASVVFGASP
jgi:3-oxoacyl-[acyl-carrier-protein] synthase I